MLARNALLQTKLWLLPVYECNGCGRQAAGQETTVEFRGDTPVLPNAVRVSNSRMPVGWSVFGEPDEHFCGKCCKEEG